MKSDSNPDFTIKYLKTAKKFSIECKYRAHLDDRITPGIRWATEKQILNYNKFENNERHPVYVVIGLGGKPSKPERMFLVPLNRLWYPFANENYLKQFERNVNSRFAIESGELK